MASEQSSPKTPWRIAALSAGVIPLFKKGTSKSAEMGCANTKEADDESKGGGGRRGTGANLKFVEMIFNQAGVKKTLESGQELIKQGSESESAYYIKDGKIDLILSDESGKKNKIATRGPGDVLGELSLLLGHDASVSATANGPVSVIEVKSAALLGMLREDPVQSGRLFKVSGTHAASARPVAPHSQASSLGSWRWRGEKELHRRLLVSAAELMLPARLPPPPSHTHATTHHPHHRPPSPSRARQVMATYLSERISELSGRMRSNVTAKTASGPAPASNMPATDIAKAHAMFQLPKEEKLISVYQCSVRPPTRPSAPAPFPH